jgi:ubiquinone/menaquinone biosynthesis C-methylase UbiE
MTKNTIREQFGAHASAYASSEIHAKGASLARLVELLQPQPEWDVLDVATGAGHTALTLAPHVAHVTATDITSQMLEQAHRLAAERGLSNITVETADAEALPYDDGRFDLVTCRIAPHHFADIPLFLNESVRVLRPGRLLAVVDNIVPPGSIGSYINAFEKLRDPSHGRCLSSDEWIIAFQAAGLKIQHRETLRKIVSFSFWAKRHNETMQSYLLAMLSETSGETARFLQPEKSAQDTTFTLREGLFIGQKAS